MSGTFDRNLFENDAFETTNLVPQLSAGREIAYNQTELLLPLLLRVNPRIQTGGTSGLGWGLTNFASRLMQQANGNITAAITQSQFFPQTTTYPQTPPWWGGYEP